MDKQKLEEAIEKIKSILNELDADDSESKNRLEQLSDQINDRIHSEGTEGKETISDRVKEAALLFEVKHPRVAEALNEIKVALYGMGL